MLFVCTNKREVTQDSNIHILDREDRWFERSKIGILRSPRTSFFEQRRGPQTVTTSQPHPWDLSPEESTITTPFLNVAKRLLWGQAGNKLFFNQKLLSGYSYLAMMVISDLNHTHSLGYTLNWRSLFDESLKCLQDHKNSTCCTSTGPNTLWPDNASKYFASQLRGLRRRNTLEFWTLICAWCSV